MSLMYGLSPSASSLPGTVAVRDPTRPLRSICGSGSPRRDAAGKLHGIDDLHVAGAPAEVAGEPSRNLLAGRVRVLRRAGSRPSSRCPASRTRTATRRPRRSNAPRLAPLRRQSFLGDDAPSLDAGRRLRAGDHRLAARSITVQAPHDPSGAHPSLTDVSAKPSLSNSSRLAPSATSIETGRPFSVRSTRSCYPRARGRGSPNLSIRGRLRCCPTSRPRRSPRRSLPHPGRWPALPTLRRRYRGVARCR